MSEPVESLEGRRLCAGDGFSAVYFNNTNFTGASGTRVDAGINLTSSTALPSGVTGDFSARWSSQYVFANTTNYKFRATVSDGVRVWVDDRLVIDSWVTRSSSATVNGAFDVPIVAGQKTHVVFEYYNDPAAGTAQATLEASSNGGSTWSTLATANAYSGQRDFPADSGYINIKNFVDGSGVTRSAAGDGITDDTAVIQAAMNLAPFSRFIYFPNGTYRITAPITLGSVIGDAKYCIVQGQNRDNVVLKLDDADADFQTATSAGYKPLMSFWDSTSSGSGQGFRNAVYDMTFNVGKDNPGATGLRFMSNNQGGIRDVTFKAEPSTSDGVRRGYSGLDLTRPWPGPSIYRNILVDGFSTGVDIGNYQYGETFEYLTLQNQSSLAVRNYQNIVEMRNVQSRSNTPFYDDGGGEAMLVLIDSKISRTAATSTAFVVSGEALIRNTSVSGYTTVVDNSQSGMADVTDPSILLAEYSNGSRQYAGFTGNRTTGLNLAIEETPDADYVAPTDWVKVDGSLADDDTAAFNSAIAAANSVGKKVLYLTGGTYKVSSTINVTGGIERIIGMESSVQVIGSLATSTNPVFRFQNLTSNQLIFERFNSSFPPASQVFTWLENNTNKTLVFKSIQMSGDGTFFYKSGASGTGKVFIEDVTGKRSEFRNGQKVWARQLNMESVSGLNVLNDNATLWILGYKSENNQTNIETLNGGKTEMLGGLIYPASTTVPADRPSFIINNAQASLTYRETGGNRFTIEVRETRGTETRDYSTNPYGAMPLFIGAPAAVSLAPAGDTYVAENSSSTNYGTSTSLLAKKGSGVNRIVYLKFDLSAYTSLTSFKLRLFGSSNSATENVSIGAYGVTNSTWGETAVTWATRPASGTTLLASQTISGTTGAWYEWDLSSYFLAEIAAGRTTATVALTGTANTTAVATFNSREAASNQAVLQVS